jgi:hypothetical protein
MLKVLPRKNEPNTIAQTPDYRAIDIRANSQPFADMKTKPYEISGALEFEDKLALRPASAFICFVGFCLKLSVLLNPFRKGCLPSEDYNHNMWCPAPSNPQNDKASLEALAKVDPKRFNRKNEPNFRTTSIQQRSARCL